MQPSLPLGKRVQDTSIQAYREIAPTLQPREQRALSLITRWPDHTARELMERGGITDPNELRPRISQLEERGQVRKGDKRKCSVTGKVAYTWRLVQE